MTKRSGIFMFHNPLSILLSLAVFLLLVPFAGTSICAGEQDKQQHDHTNALAKESSPYLLMHAHNPVDWHAWNEATLDKAKRANKPIFLSIGYSSCHWCHVMERESFLDDEIAEFLNKHFICIKVDREERPDVDQIYMNALLQITGRGGWPLSMFMTPDGRPFFGGTYWPARDGDRGARMGFLSIVKKVEEHYRTNRELVEQDAKKLTEATANSLSGSKEAEGLPLQFSWGTDTVTWLSQSFDPTYGGFRFNPGRPNIPKFPEPSNLFFLIDRLQYPVKQTNEPDDQVLIKNMLVTTCESMMMGGIYDHIGGGFHRYSVDRYWRIPHFEKMLYDNGQLASVYSEAYALTGRNDFKRTVEGTLDFVQSELTAPNGAFYSSLDAESEGIEGKYYRWDKKEVQKLLGEKDFLLFAKIYRLDEPPNFESDFYAPQLKMTLTKHAKEMSISEDELVKKLDPMIQKLFQARNKRKRPLLDHKILTAWNGLMIRGFADAGRILKRQDYIDSAIKAAEFLLKNVADSTGRLKRTHTDGKARLNAYLIDYACLVDGLLAIHRATQEKKWLDAAIKIQKRQDDLFWDSKTGGYFYTSSDHEVLIVRSKPLNDGAMPSGNSVAAGNLWYLGQVTGDATWTKRCRQTALASSRILTRGGQILPRMLVTVSKLLQAKNESE